MKYKLKVYNIMDPGQRKDSQGNPHQEDSIFPQFGKATEADRLFILCDGMGGHDAGEVASATVCEAMSYSILSAAPDPEGNFTPEMLEKAISDAFLALDQKDTGALKKMGTTMTLLKFYDKGAVIAHMGDSRVYHIRPGKDQKSTEILFQTRDHSLVNDLVACGELTPEEAKTSRQRNVITRAMQPNMERRPKASVKKIDDIRPGDMFYLCSDGMLENMEDPQICYNFSDAAGDDNQKVRNLTLATRENKDNHSAIIVRVTDVIDPIAAPVTPPVLDQQIKQPVTSSIDIEDEDRDEITDPPVTPPPFIPASGAPKEDAPQLPPAPATRSGKSDQRRSKSPMSFSMMIAIICAIVVVGSICVYFIKNSDKEDQKKDDETEKVDGVRGGEGTPLDENNTEQKQEQNVQPKQDEETVEAESTGKTKTSEVTLNNPNIEFANRLASSLFIKKDSTNEIITDTAKQSDSVPVDSVKVPDTKTPKDSINNK